LQQQLQTDVVEVTAAQVTEAADSEAADSERLNVTFPGCVTSRLKQQAFAEWRSCSSLTNFLIKYGIRRHGPLG
jgi:hypothetical protein